jgi:hypothetical protein
MNHVALLRLSWPPQALWPNCSRGKHWGNRIDADADYHQEGSIAAYGQIGTLRSIQTPVLRVSFHKKDRGRFDLDNAYAALKPAIDGVFKKWGRDDSEVSEVTLVRGGPVKGGCVMIEITEGDIRA